MHTPRTERLTAAALATLLPACAAAGDYLGLQRYTLREGLPQLTVTSLAEAQDGHLWIGTQEGLARFDGQQFDVFRHQPGEPGSLISSSIDSLAVDAEGRLWIGTNDGGVEVRSLKGGALQRIGVDEGLAHPTVGHLLPYAAGAIAGTPRGFDRLQREPARAEPLRLGEEAVGLALLSGQPFGLDRRCQLWRLDTQPAQALPTGLPPTARCAALAASADSLWLVSPALGLFRLDAEGAQLGHWPPAALGDPQARPSALRALASGAVLIGFEDGSLARLESAQAEQVLPLRLSARAGSRITTLSEHGSGTLWIGTYASGLLRAGALSSALDAGPAGPTGLGGWPTRSIYAVWRDSTQILLGTDLGLLRHRPQQAGWETVDSIGQRPVRRILPRPQGGFWIGTLDGLWQLQADDSAVRIEGVVDQRIGDLAYQGQRLWISTRDGLSWLEQDAPSQSGVPDALRRGFLTALLVDPAGNLWVGSNESGLRVLTTEGGMRWLHRGNARLTSDSVWSLHAVGDAVYAGTHGGGLQRLRLDDAAAWHLGLRDGLSNNVVYRIESDRGGRLWLSTNRGLNLVEPGQRSVTVLRESDGLANTEYNAGASFQDAQGRLYFGGTEGLDVLDPDAVSETASRARPLLSRLEVVGRRQGLLGNGDPDWQAISLQPPLRFDWNDRVLAATLVALDFSAPDAARLRYRLVGLDQNWIEPRSPRSEVLLSGLRHGDYQLEMQAAGRDRRFGPTRSLAISIAAPPWASPLAYALYALAALLLLSLIWLQYQRESRAKRQRLAQLNLLVAQRTADLEAANQLLRQSNQRLDQAGRTDPLTRVSNRRDLHEWLAARADSQTAAPRGRGLLFCLIDIDDFKQINDRLGHKAGDEVLVAFASRLREACRDDDMVVRWGGEEFLLVLQAARQESLPALLDRLLQRSCEPVLLSTGSSVPIGCSIGVAGWPFAAGVEAGDWEQSVVLADRALYRAKAEGKQAWQYWRGGPALQAGQLADLLAGAEPEHLGAGAVSIERSGLPPRPGAGA